MKTLFPVTNHSMLTLFCSGITKQELAPQLNEVWESLKNDESGFFVQGIENLQKELIEAPLRKMKPNSMHTGVNKVLVLSNPDQEVSDRILWLDF